MIMSGSSLISIVEKGIGPVFVIVATIGSLLFALDYQWTCYFMSELRWPISPIIMFVMYSLGTSLSYFIFFLFIMFLKGVLIGGIVVFGIL